MTSTRPSTTWITIVAMSVLVGGAASLARADDAQALYDKSCASCHGAAGKGDGPVGKMIKPPPHDFAGGLRGMSDADIAKSIKEGGKAVGKAATMPAFSAKLTDEQIQGLVSYVKGLSSK